jgi:hypothetical protein
MHPILTGTIAYLLMGAVANVLCMFWPAAMKDRGLTNLLVWTTTVCLWLMWVITYCMQMNPLIEPIPKVFGGSE